MSKTEKRANASKAWPTTKVMKGATPPATMERQMAGSRRKRRWRRGMKEKRSRIEGEMVDVGDIVVCCKSFESMDDRGDSS